ncbi:MAG: endonuclease/exonuclease/phosphatase family protein [Syntrophorhabdales bacterium]|jgi:endonuclease/exonuclease/phosphatase family metal-dependent hydrolase
MEAEGTPERLANLLALMLPVLAKAGKRAGEKLPPLWSRLLGELQSEPRLKEALDRVIASPSDPDALVSLASQVKGLLEKNQGLARIFEEMTGRGPGAFPEHPDRLWRDVLKGDDMVLARLEMVYLLRSGIPPEKIATRFQTEVNYLFQLNARFSLTGVAGLLSDRGMESWLDRLDRNDPILRRLDMVGLLRAGTPPPVVARQYNALEEYVERIHENFSRHGVAGILTDEDVDRFRSVNPATVRVCSYNLHGMHRNGDEGLRLRHIAKEIARLDPQAAALQEVLSGAGIEDTGAQIARWISSMTGYHYRSQFSYCHHFMEKYPEGIALSVRCRTKNMRTIDLTRLPDGLRPVLPRNALIAETEIFGRKIILGSVHLDHIADPNVRLAQAQKLVAEVNRDDSGVFCSILAGDFNDAEDSPAIQYMKSAGYVDAYRACHRGAGNTYPAGDAKERIDYIFVRGRATIVSSGLLANDPGLSDHIGIFAEMR